MLVAKTTLERIQASLQIPDEEWLDLFDLDVDAGTQSASPRLDLDDATVCDLADFLEITPEALYTGNIDYAALARLHNGHVMQIPEKYAVGAYSRVRTSNHLLECLESRLGWRQKLSILRSRQLSESLMQEPDAKINVRFVTELCQLLASAGVSHPELADMGKHSVVSNYASPLGEAFRKLTGPGQIYEKCFTEIINRYYDENFSYTLSRLTSNSCTVEARPHARVLDELKVSTLGSVETCAARGGTFASLALFQDLPEASVRETHCIHRGDPACKYEIDFSVASRLSSGQLSSRPRKSDLAREVRL